MELKNVADIYQLSPTQQGMFFQEFSARRFGLYVEQITLNLQGELDITAFSRAWKYVLYRHSVLRTSFHFEDIDNALQVVHRSVKLPWKQLDWRGRSYEEQTERVGSLLKEDIEQGFDLSNAPLLRLTLIQLAEDRYQFVWTYHHLILDGWSVSVILKEVMTLYVAFRDGFKVDMEPSRPYLDFIKWLQQRDLVKAEIFWRQTLKGFVTPTLLNLRGSTEYGRPDEDGFTEQETLIPAGQTALLQSVALQQQLSLNTMLQGAWALLLCRYSGQEDVVYGITVSSRPADIVGIDFMAGLFIDTVPLRVHIVPEQSVFSWLKELQNKQAEIRLYEHCAPVQIQAWSDVSSKYQLFENIFVFENYPTPEALHYESLRVGEIRFSGGRTHYPMTVIAVPGSELLVRIIYNRRRYGAEIISAILNDFKRLLTEIVEYGESAISRLPLWQEPLLPTHNGSGLRPDSSSPLRECLLTLPRTETEKVVADIWAQVLGTNQIGVHDDFFDLGGHSLQAMQVLSRIRETFQIELSIINLFTLSFTVEELSKMIDLSPKSQADEQEIAAALSRS